MSKLYEEIFLFLSVMASIVYVIFFFKLYKKEPKSLLYVHTIYRIYIAFLLLFIFNPFYKINICNFHRKIAFSAGLNLLGLNTILSYLSNKKIHKKIENNDKKIENNNKNKNIKTCLD